MAGWGNLKLTEALQAAICKAIKKGNYGEVAAEAAGVSRRTFWRWMARGKRSPRGHFGRFRHAVLVAENEEETELVGYIRSGAKEDPKCAEWLLARKHPERWGESKKELAELKILFIEQGKKLDELAAELARRTAAERPEDPSPV